MSLDTRSKRASSLQYLKPFIFAPVYPDGTLGKSDRAHILSLYSFIYIKYISLSTTHSITDVVGRAANYFRSLSAVQNISDAITRIRGRFRIVLDAMQMNDFISNARGLYRQISSTLNLADLLDYIKNPTIYVLQTYLIGSRIGFVSLIGRTIYNSFLKGRVEEN
jgi:hypothetical protein